MDQSDCKDQSSHLNVENIVIHVQSLMQMHGMHNRKRLRIKIKLRYEILNKDLLRKECRRECESKTACRVSYKSNSEYPP